MKYMMLICGVEGHEMSPDEQAVMAADTEAWVAEMDGRGVRRFGDRLRHTDAATTVE